MRVTARLMTLIGVLALALAGCGSPSYASKVQRSLGHLRATITAYNASHTDNLQATGVECAKAEAKLAEDDSVLTRSSPPRQYRRLVTDVRSAYLLAHQGFADCAAAARSLDYLRMTRAGNELAAANRWIAKARTADR